MVKCDITKSFSNSLFRKKLNPNVKRFLTKPNCTKLEYIPPKDTVTLSRSKIKFVESTDPFNPSGKILMGDKQIGEVCYSQGPDPIKLMYPEDLKATYPQSWFEDGKILPYLDISEIGTLGNQGRGYGRLAIQELYKLSVKMGFGGRMSLESLETAKGFYSKLGFDIPVAKKVKFDKITEECLQIVKEKGLSAQELAALLKDRGVPEKINGKYNLAGERFFNPTEENLALLFPKN